MNTAFKSTQLLLDLYQQNADKVTDLQLQLQAHYSTNKEQDDNPHLGLILSYIQDRITLFRFLKKANYTVPEAFDLLIANLSWRIETGCDTITPRDLEDNPLWIDGLVQLQNQDKYGHPLLTIRLAKYTPAPTAVDFEQQQQQAQQEQQEQQAQQQQTPSPAHHQRSPSTCSESDDGYSSPPDGGMDKNNNNSILGKEDDAMTTKQLQLKEQQQQQQQQQQSSPAEIMDRFYEYKRYIIFVLECTRKLLWESSKRHAPAEHALQATLLLDLQGASVSDLDHQLILYLIDLLKNRYPSCIAQVYVMNYSWMFGGIWTMLKRALPETARARVSFPSSAEELLEHIDREELSTDFGGLDDYQYDPETCQVFHYFGYPVLSLQPGTPTVALSRVNSSDSLYFDAVGTPLPSPGLRPHHHHDSTGGLLFMTPMGGQQNHHHHHQDLNGGGNLPMTLRRTRSNSIPTLELNNNTNNKESKEMTTTPKMTKIYNTTRAPLLRTCKSTAHLPSFMITPTITTDLPIHYPLSKRERHLTVGGGTGGSHGNGPKGFFIRLLLKPNSIYMKLMARQVTMREKVTKVVKQFVQVVFKGNMKNLLVWMMALVMLQGDVWQLIAATVLKAVTMVGEGDDLLFIA